MTNNMVSGRPASQGGASLITPDFFLAGAPKCGTTSLSTYLGAHPDVFMARKEMHHFGRDLRFGPQFYRRDRAAYLAEFDARRGQKHAGEASVWYLFSTRAAREIKAFNPDARIIVMLREPTAMLHSLYHQFRWDGNENLPTFREALAAADYRRCGLRLPRLTYLAQVLDYRKTALYSEQLRRYFDVFGRERVYVVIYDDFAANPRSACEKALRFLGADPTQGPTGFKVVNPCKNVRSRLVRAVFHDPVLRSLAVAVARRLPRPLFRLLQGLEGVTTRINTRPMRRSPLEPGLCAQLRDEFAPEVERLSELLGRDLTFWNRPDRPVAIPVQFPSRPADEFVPSICRQQGI